LYGFLSCRRFAAAYVDAMYYPWYCLLVLREREIGKFISAEEYRLPCGGTSSDTEAPEDRIVYFPVFDLDGRATLGKEHVIGRWEKSLLGSLGSFTPLLVYASQLCGSAMIVLSFTAKDDYYHCYPLSRP